MTDARIPVAGWYPDPEEPAGERWWNGTGWSDHRRGGSPGSPIATTDDAAAPPPPVPTTRTSTAPSVSVAARPLTRFNTMALVGLVVSLSTVVFPLFGINGIVGAVFGFLGLRDARRRREAGLANTGRGLAIGAIVSGIALTILLWAAFVGFFVFLAWITTLPYTYVN